MTTAKPSPARRLAIAKPIPRVPPVTRATRSLPAMVGSYRPSPRPPPRARREGVNPTDSRTALVLSRGEGGAEESRDGSLPGDRGDPRRRSPVSEPFPLRKEDQAPHRAALRGLRPAVPALHGFPPRSGDRGRQSTHHTAEWRPDFSRDARSDPRRDEDRHFRDVHLLVRGSWPAVRRRALRTRAGRRQGSRPA